jgi:N-acetylglutamate synthase-like GNAT family acetyltransferase
LEHSLNNIIDLRNEPEHIFLLAKWHHQEWSHLNPKQTDAALAEKMQSYLGSVFIPSMYIYKSENQLAGSAAIINSDMDTHTELTPWLANVYVHAPFRGRGIGTALVTYAMQQSRLNGIDKLFLFTPNETQFYKRLGWDIHSQEDYRGSAVTIMSVQLSGAA